MIRWAAALVIPALIRDNGYGTSNDYAVGHNAPGDLVDHAGNPASNSLRDWLSVVAAWSRAHPAHAPLVVMLDLKDDLTDNPSFQAGNLAALNQELSDVFGSSLATAADHAAGLPSVDALRGRVLPLLSGHRGSRAAYRRDVGYRAPATSTAFITAARRSGNIVRGWGFNSSGNATDPPANHPATDRPWESWYETLMDRFGAVT